MNLSRFIYRVYPADIGSIDTECIVKEIYLYIEMHILTAYITKQQSWIGGSGNLSIKLLEN